VGSKQGGRAEVEGKKGEGIRRGGGGRWGGVGGKRKGGGV